MGTSMNEGISILGLVLAVSLALVHIFAGRGRWLNAIPQELWTSFAGGISIAYIFLDVFPELSHAQTEIEKGNILLAQYLENHVYLLSLVGLALFYGLEQMALRSPLNLCPPPKEDSPEASMGYGIFWIHTLSFAIYNAVLGYLFRESAQHGVMACLILFIALALHFMVNDIGLRRHHPHTYDRFGRWVLAGAIIIGWSIGQAATFSEAFVSSIWAITAGGIILNVLKEELPEKKDSHFGWFLTGAAGYTMILLAM
ncbi:MAG: hypothetical protein AAFR58_24150 [Cyanobacteria bacterium J06627_28]